MEGFFFFSLFFLAIHRTESATLVIDGVSQLSNPIANIGDTIIFKHKYQYNLYIFRTREAFNACNFTQATSLSNPNSTTYTWHASRPGHFYFSFYNDTNKPCQEGQKIAIEISALSPAKSPATSPGISPPDTPGGVVSSSPVFPWPFQPREKDGSDFPSPAPVTAPAPDSLPVMPEKRGSIPFISSNPAAPLPSGEVDSATIRPWPFSVNHAPSQGVKMVGLIEALIYLCIALL